MKEYEELSQKEIYEIWESMEDNKEDYYESKTSPEYIWYENGMEGLYREGEETIAKNGYLSYYYAKNKLHTRFKAGEGMIAAYTEHSYQYAVDVIDGRFELAEALMRCSEERWKRYLKFLESKGIKI